MEDADAGCYLFGDLRDTCRHIRNPISQMIVNKHRNEAESAYDSWVDYYDEFEICHKIQQDICRDVVNAERYDYYVSDEFRLVRDYSEFEAVMIIKGITERYKRYIHPYCSPWQKLKEAFAEWRKDFVWRHFKCYFRRKGK